MRKTFKLTHPKINPDRLVESIKHDIKKYLKRERGKNLPEGVDFWDFNCKFGATEAEAETVHVADINKLIDQAAERQIESFYVEILAKPGHRSKRPTD